jgi:hypothetical protein
MADTVKLFATTEIGYAHELVEDEDGNLSVVPVLDGEGNRQPTRRRIKVRLTARETLDRARLLTPELQAGLSVGELESLVEVAGIWAGAELIEQIATDPSVEPADFFFRFIPWVIEQCVPFSADSADTEALPND